MKPLTKRLHWTAKKTAASEPLRSESENVLLISHNFMRYVMCEFKGGDRYGDELTN